MRKLVLVLIFMPITLSLAEERQPIFSFQKEWVNQVQYQLICTPAGNLVERWGNGPAGSASHSFTTLHVHHDDGRVVKCDPVTKKVVNK